LIVASPATATAAVPLSAVELARASGAIAAPFLFATGTLSTQPVSLAGVDLQAAHELTRFWHIEGSSEPDPTGCLAGVNLAQRFHLTPGANADLHGAPCRITGIVSTGGAEDNELILPFEAVAKLTGIANSASMVQIRAPGERLEEVRAKLEQAYPQTSVRIVQAVAETETSVVRKIRVILFLLLALILVITTMSVTSNFSELVMERSREIGILKAIGAAERKIASLFVAETVLLALASAVAGYAAGVVLAGYIGRQVFAVPFGLHIQLPVLLLAAAITLAVALSSTALAGVSIWRIQPARILRGE